MVSCLEARLREGNTRAGMAAKLLVMADFNTWALYIIHFIGGLALERPMLLVVQLLQRIFVHRCISCA